MRIVGYLAQHDRHIAGIRERLALAKSPTALVAARSVPEIIHQVQTLPLRAVLVDIDWPRATWTQLHALIRETQPQLPVYALAPGATQTEWWHLADDLLRLDESLDLFLYRLDHREAGATAPTVHPPVQAAPQMSAPSLAMPSAPGLLENPQFRQFAEILAGTEEATIVEGFAGWVQQACQASRAVVLLRDPLTGDFVCRAHRGLPSALVPHCTFPLNAPICRWLAAAGHILLKDALGVGPDVLGGLDLMQAVVAVPIVFDGQLVGILGLGPRIVGQAYNAMELQGLFALGGQIAMALHHQRMHRTIRAQQEMTEHMLGVMPTGTVVLGEDDRIAFANTTAAMIMGQTRSSLQGADLRALPSPLGDLAFESLRQHRDLPRRELDLLPSGRPVAVTAFALPTTPPSSFLLLEDLSAQRQLEAEHERRLNLEVVTNLVHYLAHELRNPLVALSTFNSLVSSHAGDPEFQQFCQTVLHAEIGRVNLIIEQLLVLTHHAEFQFGEVDLAATLTRITSTDEMQSSVVVAIPTTLPSLYGDAHRLETAFACILRTLMHLATPPDPINLRVEVDESGIAVHADVTINTDVTPAWLLNPWQQLMGGPDTDVDFGLATAQFIIEQHGGSLAVSLTGKRLASTCRLPISNVYLGQEEAHHGARESSRR